MALIEVVLLAGPAFAVSARQQQRSLALMAATGGTPKQSRRVDHRPAPSCSAASAAVARGRARASALAWLLRAAACSAVRHLVRARSTCRGCTWPGIAGFGLLSAFLAALVPAYLASRQDVVAVLAGRRGDRAPSLKSPLLGLVLLGVGIAGSAFGATRARAASSSSRSAPSWPCSG